MRLLSYDIVVVIMRLGNVLTVCTLCLTVPIAGWLWCIDGNRRVMLENEQHCLSLVSVIATKQSLCARQFQPVSPPFHNKVSFPFFHHFFPFRIVYQAFDRTLTNEEVNLIQVRNAPTSEIPLKWHKHFIRNKRGIDGN